MAGPDEGKAGGERVHGGVVRTGHAPHLSQPQKFFQGKGHAPRPSHVLSTVLSFWGQQDFARVVPTPFPKRAQEEEGWRRKPSTLQGWMSQRVASKTGKEAGSGAWNKTRPQSQTGRLHLLRTVGFVWLPHWN